MSKPITTTATSTMPAARTEAPSGFSFAIHLYSDYQQIVDDANLVIDTRNATAHASRGRARVVSLAADPKPAATASLGAQSRKKTAMT